MLLRWILPPLVVLASVMGDRLMPIDSQAWLATHNKLRAKEFAADMQEMIWDPALAKLASDWAATCLYRHRPQSDREDIAGYKWVGENLYIAYGSGKPSPQAVLENPYYGWYGEERPHWSFRNSSCASGRDCEHFTQVVWSSSCAVGCAIMRCDKLKLPESRLWTDAYYVVCNYGPAGNLVGRTPFTPGKQCAACPTTCHNGLCPSQCTAGTVPSKAKLQVKFQPTSVPVADPSVSTPGPLEAVDNAVLSSRLGGVPSLLRLASRQDDNRNASPITTLSRGPRPLVPPEPGRFVISGREPRWGRWEGEAATPAPFVALPEGDGRRIVITTEAEDEEGSGSECVDAERGCAHHGSAACRSRSAYRGDWARTVAGLDCIAWSEYSDGYPSLGKHNFCRNPDADASPWCYVAVDGEVSFDFCFPDCPKESVTPLPPVPSAVGIDTAPLGLGTNVTAPTDANLQSLLEAFKVMGGEEASSSSVPKERRKEAGKAAATMGDGPCVDARRQCARLGSGHCARQLDYVGTRNTTVSGRTCQAWTSQTPHKHGFEPNGRHNYCRIKGAASPWCFTTDAELRWEYCFDVCPDCVLPKRDCAMHALPVCLDETLYQGKKNRTITGLACQAWSSQSPHEHEFESHGEHNFCRTKGSLAPWCFTTEAKTRWEFCFRPCNEEDIRNSHQPLKARAAAKADIFDTRQNGLEQIPWEGIPKRVTSDRSTKTSTAAPFVVPKPSTECVLPRRNCARTGSVECVEAGKRDSYRGKRQTTVSGRVCQPWSAQSPHKHQYQGLGNHNFCRAKGADAPWCFTTDARQRWEYCFERCSSEDEAKAAEPLPLCVLEKRQCAKRGSPACRDPQGYLGNKSSTMNGIRCQSWASQEPNVHTFSANGNHSACRTSGDGAPWCLTTDPQVEWEYCFRPCDAYDLNNPARPVEDDLMPASHKQKAPLNATTSAKDTETKTFSHPILHPASSPFPGQETLLAVCDERSEGGAHGCADYGAEKLCRHHGYAKLLSWTRRLERSAGTESWTRRRRCEPSGAAGCWRYHSVLCAGPATEQRS